VADADLLREKSEIFAILTTKVLGFSKMTTGRWASSKSPRIRCPYCGMTKSQFKNFCNHFVNFSPLEWPNYPLLQRRRSVFFLPRSVFFLEIPFCRR
jgi:hypothetical protein